MSLPKIWFYLIFLLWMVPSPAHAACGAEGQRACCIGERAAGACDPGTHEVSGCSGDCRCRDSIFSSSGTCVADDVTTCGGKDQRACCVGERAAGACDAPLTEIPGCSGDCRCRASVFSSSGTCRGVTECGHEGQRACCTGEASFGNCEPPLWEKGPAPPDALCRGGFASSLGTCVRPSACGGENQRACCVGERPEGACDAGLYEQAGAPASGDNTCWGGLSVSSGTCVGFSHCGAEGERGCCLGERATVCDPGLIQDPGAPPNSRCSNNLLNSSGHCRKLVPHWENLQSGACSYVGLREWSATLIDGDVYTCWEQPGDVAGIHFARPSRCEEVLFQPPRGLFDVPDPSCKPHFESPSRGQCKGDGSMVRWYRAYIGNIPSRETNARKLCDAALPVTINTYVMERWSKCEQYYAEFLVPDEGCWIDPATDCPVAEPNCKPKPEACSATGGGMSQIVGTNDHPDDHDLAVWTWDKQRKPERVVERVKADESFVLEGKSLPKDGTLFYVVVLDLTEVQEWNDTWVTPGSVFTPYDPSSAGGDGAIYNSAFVHSEAGEFAACRASGFGWNLTSGEAYDVRGAGREVVVTPPSVTNPPWVMIRRPKCATVDGRSGLAALALAAAVALARRRSSHGAR